MVIADDTFGIPHASSADDLYEDIFVPKSMAILPNMHLCLALTRHTSTRYFDEKGQVKVVMVSCEESRALFWYGRQVCPGRHFAGGTLGINFAMLLWAMRFDRPEGAQAVTLSLPLRLCYHWSTLMQVHMTTEFQECPHDQFRIIVKLHLVKEVAAGTQSGHLDRVNLGDGEKYSHPRSIWNLYPEP
ncbi:hypothetical protein EDB86DRAFT_2832274 [Lactarius hatsudake]|nr:hypothetical protein EDB86DRAFT_2832274 [Lactarius hatsudake]